MFKELRKYPEPKLCMEEIRLTDIKTLDDLKLAYDAIAYRVLECGEQEEWEKKIRLYKDVLKDYAATHKEYLKLEAKARHDKIMAKLEKKLISDLNEALDAIMARMFDDETIIEFKSQLDVYLDACWSE